MAVNDEFKPTASRATAGQLAPDQLEAVAHSIEVMLDPVARSIANADFEDEEINAATALELDAAMPR